MNLKQRKILLALVLLTILYLITGTIIFAQQSPGDSLKIEKVTTNDSTKQVQFRQRKSGDSTQSGQFNRNGSDSTKRGQFRNRNNGDSTQRRQWQNKQGNDKQGNNEQGNFNPGNRMLQGSATVSGTVTDSLTGQTLEAATIALLTRRGNNTPIAGNLSDEKGRFTIENVPAGTYRVRIEYIGFHSKFLDSITVTEGKELNLGTIKISSGTITTEQIDVNAKRDVFQNSIDRKIFNVSESALNEGGTATDVLKNVPTVSVDIDGNVTMRGSGNIRILIDGRPSQLGGKNALESIPASSIERVEIISNPSAKFDPEGMSGIINIVLKKNEDQVTKGMMSLTAGTNDRYNGAFNLNYAKGPLSLNGNYSYRAGNRKGNGTSLRINNFPDTTYSINQSGDRINRRGGHNGKLGLDYDIDKLTRLSLSGGINMNTGNFTEKTGYLFTDANGNVFSNYQRTSNGFDNGISGDATLNLTKKFQEKDRQLTFDASFSRSYDRDTAYYNQLFNLPSTQDPLYQRQFQTDKNTVITVQSDYTHPFGKNGKFEAGYKSTLRKLDNDNVYANLNNGSWANDPNITNHFIYSDGIHAAYLTYSKTFKEFGFLSGLRAEFAKTNSELVTTGEKNDNNYFSIFPSLHLSKKFGETQEMQVSYSRRVNRPSIQTLNPFTDYEDPLNIRKGNPNLKPEYINSFEIGYSKYFKTASIISDIYYRQVNDVIQRIRSVDPLGISITTFENLAKADSYGLELILRNRFGNWWDLTGNFNFFNTKISGTSTSEGDLNSNSTSWFAKILSNMTLFEDLQIQLSGNYRAPMDMPQGRIEGMFSTDLGIRKDLFNKKLNVTLSVNDLFNTRNFKLTSFGPGYTQTSTRGFDTRSASLSLSYRFGSDEGNKQQQRRKGKQRDRDNNNTEDPPMDEGF